MSGPSQSERVAQALARYAREEIDEIGVAQAMDMPLVTDRDRNMAIQSVKNMFANTLRRGSNEGALVPTPLGITLVHGDGRTQIPKKVREAQKMMDGAYVFWYEINGLTVLSGHQIDASWLRGRFTFDASKTRPK